MKLPSTYQPEQYEADIYALWEKAGVFQPAGKAGAGTFGLVLPPPNANGDLHMGHALTVAIEDSLARYNRMLGKSTLYLPGADHAGFETWVVYEKLLSQEGKSRFDFSREDLYRLVWDFVQQNKHNFESQLRALGAGLDWSRFTFTLDNKVVSTSYETFHKMWRDNLIYRAKRVVNFCTFHATSFSDIEVVHEEEKTKLWHIAYPLADGSGEVVIATTRPETKLGQSALMVHPRDERYRDLVGKEVIQPLVPGKNIEIIADDYVNLEFGTGVVTVTPAHDANDFEVAKRHGLPLIELITPEGKLSGNVPEPFRGMTVMQARQEVVKALKDKGYLRKVEDFTHNIGKCYKCGTVIEPLLREQWFIRMRPLAAKAVEALKNGDITYYPKGKLTQTLRYLGEIKDWNISRQIPWGIPIPAFQNSSDPADWIFDTRVHQETLQVEGKSYRRDPDVFDTWFSSGQWPYVTLDYPGDDFQKFYPLALMETGFDIMYQWVTRMIMLGLYTTGKVPFKTVYLHGMVTDEKGQKMSKSKGNVSNPMDVIGQYGSDALRLGMLTGQTAGNNQPYTDSKVVGGRNFANKLWNVARFIEGQVGGEVSGFQNSNPLSPADHWILRNLASTSKMMGAALDKYELSSAYSLLYSFVWGDLADWYVEASKTRPNGPMLAYLLAQTLKIAHPFAPFVTETIWQTLSWEKDTFLVQQEWPGPETSGYDQAKARDFLLLKQLVTEVRWLKSIGAISPERLYCRDAAFAILQADIISNMTGVKKIENAPKNYHEGLRLTGLAQEVWLDVDPAPVKGRLGEKLKEQAREVEFLKKRLENPDYIKKAPADVVDESKRLLAQAQLRLANLESVLGKI